MSAGKVDAAVLLNEASALKDERGVRILWATKQAANDWPSSNAQLSHQP
jgi:sulfonate transport system substrate-binding protein